MLDCLVDVAGDPIGGIFVVGASDMSRGVVRGEPERNYTNNSELKGGACYFFLSYARSSFLFSLCDSLPLLGRIHWFYAVADLKGGQGGAWITLKFLYSLYIINNC
jgi:hypothetical protein